MRSLLLVLWIITLGGISQAHGKALTDQQQKCMAELKNYTKKNGKPEFSETKLKSTCLKTSNDKFLECVSGTQRSFGALDSTVKFCAKKPNSQKQTCVKTLATYTSKSGKQTLKGAKLASVCTKNSSPKFLECVASVERPLGSMDSTTTYCSKKPSAKANKCVQELASYKDKRGHQKFNGKKLTTTCMASNSDKFLNCMARNQNLGLCGGSDKRLPASH